MKELFGQILMHARGAWRFRWYAVAVAWAAALTGWTLIIMQPDIYEARARVYVDTDSVLKPLLTGLAVSTDVTNRVNMMSRVLMGRPNLERVARETQLDRRAGSPERLAVLVDSLAQQIKLEGGGGNNIYSLRYSDTDPAMAQRVVRKLLDTFVEDTLGMKRADTDSAQQFLVNQIRDYEERLRVAEDRLAEFKKQNVGSMPGETGDYYARLQAGLTQLQDLRARFRLASERRAELAKQIEGEQPTFGLFTESGGTDGRVAEYRKQLDQLLLQYTEKHPRVVALKETIAQLEAQTEAQKPRRGVAMPRDGAGAQALALDINPVYQSLRIELSRTEVEIAGLRQQIAEQEALVGNLKSRVDTVPEIEAELTRLNRDYEVNRAQHQALLQRLESARLSEQAEESTEGVKFRVIEPPSVPLVPIGPMRPLFMTAALLAALGLAGGLAVILNQLKPVFLSRGMLSKVTGLPVLGAISFVRSKPAKPLLLRDPVLIGISFAGLFAFYVIGVGIADSASRFVRNLAG